MEAEHDEDEDSRRGGFPGGDRRAAGMAAVERSVDAQKPAGGVPTFQVDPSWPKFDGNWIFGSIGGVFVDPTNDHVWVLNRPRIAAGRRELRRAEAATRRLLRASALRDGVRLRTASSSRDGEGQAPATSGR